MIKSNSWKDVLIALLLVILILGIVVSFLSELYNQRYVSDYKFRMLESKKEMTDLENTKLKITNACLNLAFEGGRETTDDVVISKKAIKLCAEKKE